MEEENIGDYRTRQYHVMNVKYNTLLLKCKRWYGRKGKAKTYKTKPNQIRKSIGLMSA